MKNKYFKNIFGGFIIKNQKFKIKKLAVKPEPGVYCYLKKDERKSNYHKSEIKPVINIDLHSILNESIKVNTIIKIYKDNKLKSKKDKSYNITKEQKSLKIKLEKINKPGNWKIKVQILSKEKLIAEKEFKYVFSKEKILENYKTSWVGNTFGTKDKWIQNYICEMDLTEDGSVWTCSFWDEGTRASGIYKDGKPVKILRKYKEEGRPGVRGYAVAAGKEYAFVGMGDKVAKYKLDGTPLPVIYETGKVKSMDIKNDKLYLVDKKGDIQIWDTVKNKLLHKWNLEDPQQLDLRHTSKIAVAPDNTLWIICGKEILNFTVEGKKTGKKIDDIDIPVAVSFDNQDRLIVCDDGPKQQVFFLDIQQKPEPVAVFGKEGGILSGTPGLDKPLKFRDLVGAETDQNGNIYIGMGYPYEGPDNGTIIKKFTPEGNLVWEIRNDMFVDTLDVDPDSDGNDVYGVSEHYKMDYSKENGQEWSHFAWTIDKYKYPDDPRLYLKAGMNHGLTTPWIRRIEGQKIMFITGMYSAELYIYRFDGEIAVPSGIIAKQKIEVSDKSHLAGWQPPYQPKKGRYIWRDLNGDGHFQKDEFLEADGEKDAASWGWWVDSTGDIWQAFDYGKIRQIKCQGLDKYGNPVYSRNDAVEFQEPDCFDELTRAYYFPNTDTMYLSGYSQDFPRIGGEWGQVGREIKRIDNWSNKQKIRYSIALPHDPSSDDPGKLMGAKTMTVAGNRMFVGYLSRGLNPDYDGPAEVRVYDSETGEFCGSLIPGPEVSGYSGWLDLPYAINAFQKSNGEYLVFVEEDGRGKVLLYRIYE